MDNEPDTCRKYVVPKLQAAGWEDSPHSIHEQHIFTDGRIIVTGGRVRRGKQKKADYLLRYTRDFPIAVVEAKAEYKSAGDGVQQAKDYAEILGLSFAYATNGIDIIEIDYLTGTERFIGSFPTPDELWARLRSESRSSGEQRSQLLTPAHHEQGKQLRYYQEIAVNRAVEAIISGRQRLLLTMATGTGKTMVAFQICWKLWNARWNRPAAYRRPKILYLADRNILVDDPKDKVFTPFGDARWKIEHGQVNKSREMYFAIYQAIAEDESRSGLFREYSPGFFDLIIVDECHRGSARDTSSWREILEYFALATQLGMTATPLREDNRDTYNYFGEPLYQYSLRQGIDDGFLAPYRVHRVITTWDAAGWRPMKGQLDRYGEEIPDEEYQTKDFERVISLRSRTEAIARHLTTFLKQTDRFAKTIVFCVDQEHADEMRRALGNLNADLVQQFPDYVCRVTANEGDIGRGHLSRFQELETRAPVILTTSQLLSTGVDAPTCKNVVIVRAIGSMPEFKQIIGRGTRLRDDYGKYFFNIIDYTGAATRMFADPDFDGDPVDVTIDEVDDEGNVTATVVEPVGELPDGSIADEPDLDDQYDAGPLPRRRKYYVDGSEGGIAAHVIHELDPDGKQLRVVLLTDYTAEKVRVLFPSASDLRAQWADPGQRAEIIAQLEARGIDFDDLAKAADRPDAEPLDLLCHLAFNAPLRTRRERAERLRRERPDFFDQYGPEARTILDALLDKYTAYGSEQFSLPAVLKLPPLDSYGNVSEIAGIFGGAQALKDAVVELQALLYAA